MNIISKIKQFLRIPEKPKPYTVFWATLKHIPGPVIEIDYEEYETGTTIITNHACTYEAYSIEQALAMHRSDNPDSRPTSIMFQQ